MSDQLMRSGLPLLVMLVTWGIKLYVVYLVIVTLQLSIKVLHKYLGRY